MKKVPIDLIKELKSKTGVGLLDCKKALEETDCDIEKAIEYLRKKGIAESVKRESRETSEGRIEAYIHYGSRLGVLLDIRCETDFTANTPEFKQLAEDIAMQIAATNPQWISRNDVPKEVIEKELEIYREQSIKSGKPEKVIEQIAKGKLEKFFKENCLLEQPFIKDNKITIDELIKEYIFKLKENIKIKRFVRFAIE